MHVRRSVLFWLGSLAIFAGTLLVAAMSLPEQVATHFNAQGKPDAWTSRTRHLLEFAAFGAGFSAFFVGLFYGIRFLPPGLLNVSNADFWRAPENYPRACQFLFEQSFPLASLAALFAAGLNLLLVKANLELQPALPVGSVLLLTGAFLAGMMFRVVHIMRYFRNIHPPGSAAHE